MGSPLDPFKQIWCCDFEFNTGTGDKPVPVCLVAHELRSRRTIRLWHNQFKSRPPYPTGPDSLFISFFANAEVGCHLALGWPVPVRILDLFVEFRNATNGEDTLAGNSLLGALSHFGLDHMGAAEKKGMRDLVLRGGPWTLEERRAILQYCSTDVTPLPGLLSAMLRRIDFPRALYRGRYMAAVARMEFAGVPIDVELLDRLRSKWIDIQEGLIREVDADYGVYEGRSFRTALFEEYLVRQEFGWPRLTSGQLDLSRDAFKDMARVYPAITSLHELRHSLSELRLNKLAVGHDGRNRCLLSPFASRTSRNQPSNSKFIFGPSTWLRSLIQPSPGWGVAYIDYSAQEFAVAAYLSGDPAMIRAYETGDPYLATATPANAAPSGATKETHSTVRDMFKTVCLGIGYGMESESLSHRIGKIPIVARHLLRWHRELYSRFWEWGNNTVDHARLLGWQLTPFAWVNCASLEPNPRSLRNFPMQATGAEMLRLACCLTTEAGIEVVAPVHDALMIAAPIDRLDADVAATREFMEVASRVVVNCPTLLTT